MNLDKQIKRHIIGRLHHFYAVVAPGLEALCTRELAGLSDTIQLESSQKGGVAFSGRLEDLYRANLHLRTAGRILLRLAEFKATNFRQLEKKTAQMAWDRYLPVGAVPDCKASAHRSRLYHSQAVARTVQSAIRTYWQDRDTAPGEGAGQTLFVHLDQDTVLLSLDSTGANLYRRGLKTHGAPAPLRETLAAAVLLLSGYDPERPLHDPMCGSGTFALEAALMAKRIPPGYARGFAFMQWPSFRSPRWHHLMSAAAKQILPCRHPLIHASDIDPAACRRLDECVQRHGLADAVQVQCVDFFSLTASASRSIPPGLIVLNPPYGHRLQPGQDPQAFYQRIGGRLACAYKGWQVAWIVPRPSWIRGIPLALNSIKLVHGGLKLTLMFGRI
jgi:putative N6-adenine-specific DNA methylase